MEASQSSFKSSKKQILKSPSIPSRHLYDDNSTTNSSEDLSLSLSEEQERDDMMFDLDM
eukprot:CAMPEP_0194174018 /NCGR_PEP_ID=MMETSP0154-20130528/8287_1 /TAXON_ID=1049557 /ORGANISM="Thalassiothrix antarctica, Strain L6-D1" /LENGTH=58 /DNA_ID=CAMNT_0038887317 /DNA_START=260 /DNA_END=436 /DNA_ORIENTATION=-